jgi:hypothetical protein
MEFRVIRCRKIFSDGRHNAFTGIASFRDKVYVTFRNGTKHQSPDGKTMVIASADLEKWDVVCERPHPDFDYRDPKIVAFRDRLFVYLDVSSHFLPPERHTGPQSRVFWSNDGVHFGPEQAIEGGPGKRVFWWATARGDTLDGAGYAEASGKSMASLFASDDGLRWRPLADFPVPAGNEVALDFDEQGVLWALVRADRTGSVPALCVADPPYTEFKSVIYLPMLLQGPMLKRLPGGSVIVCRTWEKPQYVHERVDMFWLPDGKNLEFIRTLPSGGDCSYAGWLTLSVPGGGEPGKAIISYYSSHEWKMDDPKKANYWGDIFLAEVIYW